MDLMNVGSAAAGILVGVIGAWLALRRDSRESRQLGMAEAKDTIDLLREQTEILKSHGEAREAEWHQLEQSWRRREDRFEKRISDLEGDYRQLVLTITTMGLCANAPWCDRYNPGDRRLKTTPAEDPPV